MLRNNQISKELYDNYCKALKIVLDLAEKEYHVNKFNLLGSDSKRSWETLNKLLNRNKNKQNTSMELTIEY